MRHVGDWSRTGQLPRCDMCAEKKPDVLRFGLVRREHLPKPTTRGAGGIWLCEECWQSLQPAQIRQRRRRFPAVVA